MGKGLPESTQPRRFFSPNDRHVYKLPPSPNTDADDWGVWGQALLQKTLTEWVFHGGIPFMPYFMGLGNDKEKGITRVLWLMKTLRERMHFEQPSLLPRETLSSDPGSEASDMPAVPWVWVYWPGSTPCGMHELISRD